MLRLPAGVRLVGGAAALAARVNGRPVAVTVAGERTLIVRIGGRRLRALTLQSVPGAIQGSSRSGVARVTLRGGKGSRGTLAVPLGG